MNKALSIIAAACMAVVLSGCAGAAFNRVSLTMNRNITVGQELQDLKTAHEKGIINDTEYATAKKDLLNILSQVGEVQVK
jgi:PBP1b-binding outer membrane lipoprotein LpoB